MGQLLFSACIIELGSSCAAALGRCFMYQAALRALGRRGLVAVVCCSRSEWRRSTGWCRRGTSACRGYLGRQTVRPFLLNTSSTGCGRADSLRRGAMCAGGKGMHVVAALLASEKCLPWASGHCPQGQRHQTVDVQLVSGPSGPPPPPTRTHTHAALKELLAGCSRAHTKPQLQSRH